MKTSVCLLCLLCLLCSQVQAQPEVKWGEISQSHLQAGKNFASRIWAIEEEDALLNERAYKAFINVICESLTEKEINSLSVLINNDVNRKAIRKLVEVVSPRLQNLIQQQCYLLD